MRALIRWAGGRDDGILEVVDVSWIVNYDADAWMNLLKNERPETEVIKYKKGR